MLKFHINPKTLEPKVCTAPDGRCPYGVGTVHVGEDRVHEHFAIFERTMADYTLISFSKKAGRSFDYKRAAV
jgi:hypothetical protein